MKRKKANEYMSFYILLRDAIELAERRPGINQDGTFQWVECVTCGRILDRFHNLSHAGHFVTKGHGGSSGVYFDERNVHAQCHDCNVYQEGNRVEYYPFMAKKYGQEVIDDLRLKHKLPRPKGAIESAGIYYREAYKKLLHIHGLEAERKRRGIGKYKGDQHGSPQ